MKIKTKIEIIEETAAFYNSSNRGIDKTGGGSQCVYKDPSTGNMCAVGRCLETLPENNNLSVIYLFRADVGRKASYSMLKPEYRIEDIHFWQELQKFHDTEKYWDDKGLTKDGLYRKNELLEIFAGQ